MLRGPTGSVLSIHRHQDIRGEFIIVHSECQCTEIKRFLLVIIDYLFDLTNVILNWPLYKLFIEILKILPFSFSNLHKLLKVLKRTILPSLL